MSRAAGVGTWFAVPPAGPLAVGLVSHLVDRQVAVGYFFGLEDKREVTPSEVGRLHRGDAILIRQFGTRRIGDGTWPTICVDTELSVESWPMPAFGQVNEFWSYGLRFEFVDGSFVSTRVPREEARALPSVGTLNLAGVEAVLRQSLADRGL